MKISVTLCTRNPRREFINKTLQALAAQNLPKSDWELVIVDNGSNPPLQGRLDLSDLSNARLVTEQKQGISHARQKSIESSCGELLVLVDDDNVLAPNYLSEAWSLSQSHPFLGAWGGTCLGEFEHQPDKKLDAWLPYLAIRKVTRPRWGNDFNCDLAPFGAGLCLRASVARAYLSRHQHSDLRNSLGRKGNTFLGGEDTDMVFNALQLGYGIGLFPSLSLTHLIPAQRLELDYLERLIEGIFCSSQIVNHLHGQPLFTRRETHLDKWLRCYREYRLDPVNRRLNQAMERGRLKGLQIVTST